MARRMYQSADDKQREELAIQVYCRGFDEFYRKNPIDYRADWAVFDAGTKELTEWVEVKCRDCAMTAYPDFYISVQKIVAGITLAKMTKKPFRLLVAWVKKRNDTKVTYSLYEMRVYGMGKKITPGGRTDRGDKQDKEPVTHYPLDAFEYVGRFSFDEV